jgi:hypothetical protein
MSVSISASRSIPPVRGLLPVTTSLAFEPTVIERLSQRDDGSGDDDADDDGDTAVHKQKP